MMDTAILAALEQAVAQGKLLATSLENIRLLTAGTTDPVVPAAIAQLIEKQEWAELNNRFFKTLAFGTGGLRGRTIGTIITPAEQGTGGPNNRPQFPCVGTASMNYFNVGRAMRGLITYVRRFVEQEATGRKPLIVIGHDTRHFSRDFAEFCARITTSLGCDCALFDGPCSTPEVSFAIRELNADTGVVITASHNPAHDNGFKAYFNDGAQLISPHDKAVIAEVNALTTASSYGVSGEASKGFDFLRSTIRVFGSYSLSESERLISQSLYQYHAQGLSFGGSLSFSPFEWIGIVYSSGFGQSRSYTEGHRDQSTTVRSNTQRLSMSVYPTKTLTLSLAAEDNYNNLTAENRHAWFGDASAKLKLKHIDLELQLNNLFDQRQYTRVSYSGLDIYTQTSQLRPRNAIFTVRFKLL